MSNAFIYSNARIKAREKGLLNSSQISRLADSQNANEAFKLLVEFGYGSGVAVENSDFDELLAVEEKNVAELIKELDVKSSGLSVFMTKNDFHNLKAFYKSREMGILDSKEEKFPVLAEGNISLEKIREALLVYEYDSLPKTMSDTLKYLDKQKVDGKLTPHIIDAEIDKAMYLDIFATLKRSGRKELTDYFVRSADIANISSFVRAKRLGLDYRFFSTGFIAGGELGLNFFEPLFDATEETVKEKLKYTKYSELALHLGESLSKFETECDNALLNIFKQQKNDMFSVAPLAGFFLGKTAELKVVKLIITAKKNNVEKKLIVDRMRDLYA